MKRTQGVLPFLLEVVGDDLSNVTSHAGLPVLLEAMRAIVPARWCRRLRKALGYKRWRTVRRHLESLVLLVVAGGEHISDIDVLRADRGLARLIGFVPSSAGRLKVFLYRFHQDRTGRRLEAEDDLGLSVQGRATIRPEGPGLRMLAELNTEIVRVLQRDHQSTRATLDVDATLIEAWKQAALKSYEGYPGYQPQMAWWAEQSVWVADEFRDGNVPAEYEARAFLIRAFGALPGSVQQRRLRADSALHNEAALTWADDHGIEFAVSADMSESLRAKAEAVPGSAWSQYRTYRRDGKEDESPPEERQWAEVVDFIPEWDRNHRKDGNPFRYIAIRVRSRQRDFFEGDDRRWRHFAVVTNMDWRGDRLLRWQREKQGTVEHGHGVLKGELAGGTMPCGRWRSGDLTWSFGSGANAAWWRTNVLAANLLQLVRVQALPAELRFARPKTLRFRLFNLPGLLVAHARRLVVRISGANPWAGALQQAREALLALYEQTRARPQHAG